MDEWTLCVQSAKDKLLRTAAPAASHKGEFCDQETTRPERNFPVKKWGKYFPDHLVGCSLPKTEHLRTAALEQDPLCFLPSASQMPAA